MDKHISQGVSATSRARSQISSGTISGQENLESNLKNICNYKLIHLVGLSLYENAQIIIKERQMIKNYYDKPMSAKSSKQNSKMVNSKFDLQYGSKYRSLNLNSIQSNSYHGQYPQGLMGNMSTIHSRSNFFAGSPHISNA